MNRKTGTILKEIVKAYVTDEKEKARKSVVQSTRGVIKMSPTVLKKILKEVADNI